VDVEPAAKSGPSRWLAGLRRGWTTSGALDRWVEDRGVTGLVYTPSTYEIDDLGEALARLVEAGARADKALLWDLAVIDIRAAANALRPVYAATETADGYVCVWIDPARANDPDKAVAAAAEIIGEIRRANVAVGCVWTPQRAPIIERLVASDCPVALSGVRDSASKDAVAAARAKGMARRREEAKKQKTDEDEPIDVPEVPVFLLGSQERGEHLHAVDVVTEFDLLTDGRASGRIPLSPDAEVSGLNVAIDRLAQRAKVPPRDDEYSPEPFARAMVIECNELATDEVLEDIWLHDHSIWKDDPTEIADRLGWLDVAERMHGELKDIAEFARRARSSVDARHIVLLGMGGSVLAAETLHNTLGGGVPLTVLDTTHPGHIESVRASLDLDKTIFVVGSKSGTTVETRAHLEYFWSIAPHPDRFVAITDPGSELASLARERGFGRVFENPPDIGGRYSALSYFGLVPAALCGIDLEPIVASARRAMIANGPGAAAGDAPGARLGAALAEAARKDSRDKLTLMLPPRLASLGGWIEQLVAESTGKEGLGVLPVVGEPLGGPEFYGDDRIFCVYTMGDDAPPPQLEALEDHPVVRIRMPDTKTLGAEMYRWEMATAILGYLLDINPFDQPDVESAKKRAREVLESPGGERPEAGDARALLEGISPPAYIAIQAFVAPTEENMKLLDAARVKLRDRHHVAVTVGFGPRFLHSTGQLHKGGPPTGVFLQVVDDRTTDIDVPGMGFSFGRLLDAQADGDLVALRDNGRAAARVSPVVLTEMSGVG
jgi:glucose-6-phosphate isomerase